MLNRRPFLLLAVFSAIAPTLQSCSNPNSLKVQVLKDSIPPQLLGDFKKEFSLNRKLEIKPVPQLQTLYEFLEELTQENSKKRANLVTLGDFWLQQAIQKNLIQPLAVKSLNNWQQLPPLWQEIVRRNAQGNLDPGGEIWGAPYRWGNTVIAYRADIFRDKGFAPPTDWGDLWREELRDRVSLLNQPREVIGLTLKKLGYSYNESNLESIPNLEQELATLHQQVKFYSSEAYLQPLIMDDTWIALGWSSDFLQLETRYPDIKIVIPDSGTSLWADLWVQPKQNETLPEEISQWINFCWQLEAANQIGLFTNGSSPILLQTANDQIPEDLQGDHLRIPKPDVLDKSEFLLPLSPASEQQYEAYWKSMRMATRRRD